jgi:hypothetical protein
MLKIIIRGSCLFVDGWLRLPEGDAETPKHVAVIALYIILLIYMLCICWSR